MSNLSSAGNATIAGNLSVGGTTTLSSALTSSSSAIFGQGVTTNNVNASGTVTANSIVAGSNGIDCNGDLIVIGNANLDSDLEVSGSATFDSPVYMLGSTTHSGAVTNNGTTTLNSTVNLNSNIVANSAIISPTELSYLDGGTQNINTAVTTLQTKCTDLTHSGTTNTMANNFVVSGNETVNGSLTTNGTVNLNSNIVANGATISPTELAFIDGANQNIPTAVTNLQTKTTDMTYANNKTVFGHDFEVDGNLSTPNSSSNVNLHGIVTIQADSNFPSATADSSIAGVQFFRNKSGSAGELDMVVQSKNGTNGGLYVYNANLTTLPTLYAKIDNTGIVSTNGVFGSSFSSANGSAQMGYNLPSSTSFPTTTNGTTAGFGVYWNQTQVYGETAFVNFAQGGFGGFNFFITNSSVSPQKVASISSAGGISCTTVTTTGDIACDDLTAASTVTCGGLTTSGNVTCSTLTLSNGLTVNSGYYPVSTQIGYNFKKTGGPSSPTFNQSSFLAYQSVASTTIPAGTWRVDTSVNISITSNSSKDLLFQASSSTSNTAFVLDNGFVQSVLLPSGSAPDPFTIQNTVYYTFTSPTTVYALVKIIPNYSGSYTTGVAGTYNLSNSGFVYSRIG